MTINPFRHHHSRGSSERHATHDPAPREHGVLERASDFLGSPGGLASMNAFYVAYIVAANTVHFDHFPFNFLTLILSLLALDFTQIVIIVQNRQGAVLEQKAAKERDEVEADLDMDKKAFALLTDLHDRLVPEGRPGDVVDVPDEVAAELKD